VVYLRDFGNNKEDLCPACPLACWLSRVFVPRNQSANENSRRASFFSQRPLFGDWAEQQSLRRRPLLASKYGFSRTVVVDMGLFDEREGKLVIAHTTLVTVNA
jgi:hypothetical protein